VSSGSGSGSGADQHLLALLRAIRLRQAAPDAVAAGATDAAAALTELNQRPPVSGDERDESPQRGSSTLSGPGGPAVRPGWAAAERIAEAGAVSMPGKDFFGRAKKPAPRDTPELPSEIDEVGRPSRNLFAGLAPGRKRPAPEPPATEESGIPAARPPWASGENVAQTPRVHNGETPHVAPGRRFVSAADGMDPADDELLRRTQTQLSTSLTFAGGPDEVATRFRGALLQAHPHLVAILPGDEATQVELLARAITWLVHNLDQPPVLVDGCAKLGAALDASGVRPDELRMVGAALVEAIRAGTPAGTWRQDFDLAWRSTWQHAYEWIVHGELTHAAEAGIWDAVVVKHDMRRHDLAVVKFRPLLPMPYVPGQYARIEVPELPGVWRPYSLAGAPRRNDILELHVRAKTESGVSGTLVYRTQEGDRVRFGAAEGTMTLPPPPGPDLLMIAGDTGVAPLKALLIELVDTGDPRSAVLFWGVRNLDELYDVDDLTEIARSGRRITIVPVVSEGNPGPYASGLVMDAVAAYGEWSRHEVYLAGPPVMLAATRAALYQLGVQPSQIHHDEPE
jgi:NAD(P)H-flavin reductase/hemoglobin-like flavoprotein